MGRRHESLALRRLLKSDRMITLFGPGGVGKSRLAVELALDCADRYPDGVVLVELSLLAAPELLPQTIAAALGIAERRGVDLVTTIAAELNGKRVLLVLDNCEHLADGCARFIEEFLASCPGPQLLVASREILRIPGEVAFRVEPLPLPPPGVARDREALLGADAVRLFVERARSCRPDFDLTADNGEVIASICEQLDGLPLAIELCASRVRLLDVHDILALLTDRFALLDLANRTSPDRHRSLHAAIEWSYLLLSPAEQATFRRLAVLTGGFDLAGATAVCGDEEDIAPATMLNLLAGLESKSLIVPAHSGDGSRFRQLESVRLYGLERLVEAGELRACQERVVAWLHGLAESTKRLASWRHLRLSSELENLQLATHWAEQWRDDRQVLLATLMAHLWGARGYIGKGRELLSRVLDRGIGGTADRADGLSAAAWLEFYQAEYAEAARLGTQAVELAAQVTDTAPNARAFSILGIAHANLGDFATARTCLQRCVDLWSRENEPVPTVTALQNLAYCLIEAGDLPEAVATLDKVEPMMGAAEPGQWLSFLHTRGVAALRMSDLGAAEATFTKLVRVFSANARRVNPIDLAYGLEGLAVVAARRGAPDRALRLLAAAEAIRQRLHTKPEQQWADLVADVVERSRHDAAAPDAAWAEGSRWTAEQAIAHALADPAPDVASEPGANGGAPGADAGTLLSDREREVVELIAEGRTNRQIATALGISTRTVESHADHIRSKLALRSRTQIAVWAASRPGSDRGYGRADRR